MTGLRIVTINTGKGDGPYRRRVAWLAESLRRLRPDVVLLQEALAVPGGDADTTRTLADALGMAFVFAPARRKPRDIEGRSVASDSGLGLLSRHPIRTSATMSLPEHPADGQRVALLAEIGLEGETLVVANTHLTHLRGQDALRREQLATILAHPWLAWPGRATIIGGDLNTPVARLPALLEGAGQDVRDLYAAGNGAPARATVPVGLCRADGTCVDYLLSLAPDPVAHPAVTSAAIVLDDPDPAGILPSDHRGVMVELAR